MTAYQDKSSVMGFFDGTREQLYTFASLLNRVDPVQPEGSTELQVVGCGKVVWYDPRGDKIKQVDIIKVYRT